LQNYPRNNVAKFTRKNSRFSIQDTKNSLEKDYPLKMQKLSQKLMSLSNIKTKERLLLNPVGKLIKRRRCLFIDAKEVSSWNRRDDE